MDGTSKDLKKRLVHEYYLTHNTIHVTSLLENPIGWLIGWPVGWPIGWLVQTPLDGPQNMARRNHQCEAWMVGAGEDVLERPLAMQVF